MFYSWSYEQIVAKLQITKTMLQLCFSICGYKVCASLKHTYCLDKLNLSDFFIAI